MKKRGNCKKTLDGDNFDSLVQQFDRNQTHNHEVTRKTLDVVNYHEKLNGIYPMVFMTENKLVVMLDPYGFRLLIMEREVMVLNNYMLHVPFWMKYLEIHR